MFDFLTNEFDTKINDYLLEKINILVVIFAIFIVFIIISLIIALRYTLENLKKSVFRSRILIKIIPFKELSRINNEKIR
jgi:hypothetical protein